MKIKLSKIIRDIHFRHVLETQKISQSVEHQKLPLEEILRFWKKKIFFRRKKCLKNEEEDGKKWQIYEL